MNNKLTEKYNAGIIVGKSGMYTATEYLSYGTTCYNNGYSIGNSTGYNNGRASVTTEIIDSSPNNANNINTFSWSATTNYSEVICFVMGQTSAGVSTINTNGSIEYKRGSIFAGGSTAASAMVKWTNVYPGQYLYASVEDNTKCKEMYVVIGIKN